jgi:excisionase family DNA binding protein
MTVALTFMAPPELLDALAEQAAAIVLDRIAPAEARLPYLTLLEAAEYVRAKPQRVYDLLSSGRLSRFKDGRRVIVSRAELDEYLAVNGSRRVARTLPGASRSGTGSGLRG